MLPLLANKYVVAGAAVIAVGVGAFFYGMHVGYEREHGKRVAEHALLEKQVVEAKLKKAEMENRYAEIDRTIKEKYLPELKAVTVRASDLAGQLRRAYEANAARGRSEAPATASVPDGASGDGSCSRKITDDLNGVLEACQRDAIRLNIWIEREKALQAAEAGEEIVIKPQVLTLPEMPAL